MTDESISVIAFYLPQYHPIPENDAWWGKGFTEWTNVTKARPLFPGHYQPHLPADLGFYDLRVAESREAQADLARQYGITGFCYYHYWFSGKRLLHRPFDEVLTSGRPDFPFCLCWANENWTRIWDGGDSEILMKQTYSHEDDLAHIRWLARAFADPRYIRVENKPLFIIYHAFQLPNIQKTTAIWRDECRRLGIGEIFLCRVDTTGADVLPPKEVGLDAAVEFHPDRGSMGVTLGYHRLREFRWNDLHFFLRQKLLGDNIIAYNYRHRCQLDEQTDSTRLSAVSLCYAVVGQLSSAPERSNVVYRIVTKALSSMGRRQAGQPGEIREHSTYIVCQCVE